MPAVPAIIGAVGAIGGAAVSANAQKKAAKKAADAGKAAIVNPDEVATKTRLQGMQNLRDSLEWENIMNPGQRDLRNQSVAALLGQLGGNDYINQAIQEVSAQMGLSPDQAARSELFQSAVNQAKSDLAMGGKLDTETQNAVARAGMAQAARVGGGNMGTARAIVPRDLGLTSLQVQQQRLANAAEMGKAEQAMNQQEYQNTIAANANKANLATTLANLANTDFNRYMALAQFGQGTTAPVVGLDPGQYATLFLQNATNMAQSGASQAALAAARGTNNANMIGQIAGQDWGSIINGIGGLFKGNASTSGTTVGSSPGSGWSGFDTGMGGSWSQGWQPRG